jgi:hypothetical protein
MRGVLLKDGGLTAFLQAEIASVELKKDDSDKCLLHIS